MSETRRKKGNTADERRQGKGGKTKKKIEENRDDESSLGFGGRNKEGEIKQKTKTGGRNKKEKQIN